MELNTAFRPHLHRRLFTIGFWRLGEGFVCLFVLEGVVWLFFLISQAHKSAGKSQYCCVHSGQFRPEMVQCTTAHLERKNLFKFNKVAQSSWKCNSFYIGILSVPNWINYNHVSCKIKLRSSHLCYMHGVVTFREKTPTFCITRP